MAKKTIPPDTDAEIRKAVADLATKYVGRADLSRETAGLLFFRYGIYPSAGLVHSYTRHGSMTDIAKDVQAFWQGIRETAGTKLNASTALPTIPESFVTQAGGLLEQMWLAASKSAEEALDAYRAEAKQEIVIERRAKEDAEAATRGAMEREAEALAQAAAKIAEANASAERSNQLREDALKALAVESAEKALALSQIAEANSRADREQLAREKSEAGRVADAAVHHEQITKMQERYDGEVRFAKQQIEAARADHRALQKELDDQKTTNEHLERRRVHQEQRHQEQMSALQQVNAQQVGQINILAPQAERLMRQSLELQHDRDTAVARADRLEEKLEKVLREVEDLRSRLAAQPAGIQASEDSSEESVAMDLYRESLQAELVTSPSAFEVADLMDASIEFADHERPHSDGSLFHLAMSLNGKQTPITPNFAKMAELNEFCRQHIERYETYSESPMIDFDRFW